MIIESLEIIGLYGYINKYIEFNNDLTLLVGINGSGKTSILNIINWLTKPDISQLCLLEFKTINLKFTNKQVSYKITCNQYKSSFKLTITNSKEEKYEPLRVKLYEINKILNESQRNQIIKEYSSLQPVSKEKKTWELIKSFPTPTIIGLDRNLFIDDYSGEYIEEHNSRTKSIVKNKKSPLDKVKEIVNTEYRKKKNDILNITNDLKDYLIFSAFDTGVITSESLYSSNKYKITTSSIRIARDKVNEYFNKLELHQYSDKEKSVLNNYFEKLYELLRMYSENREDPELQTLYNLNSVQFKRIAKILVKFEEFENRTKNALELINIFLSTTNYFLKDSAKQLVFKEDTAELAFNALDKNSNIIGEFKDVKYLSSGEQQILILFSYLAFNSNNEQVFIIDEPELSLHIKWQEDFLEQLDKIAPKSTQIILATHSPVIVSNRRDNVKLLLPYNN